MDIAVFPGCDRLWEQVKLVGSDVLFIGDRYQSGDPTVKPYYICGTGF